MTAQSKPISVRGTAWRDSKAQIVRVGYADGRLLQVSADVTGAVVDAFSADGLPEWTVETTYANAMSMVWKLAMDAVAP